uniref:Uncharacterized protein n=1 Tax=viral metagenome TaxID=1070528 RepID=A0A6C0AQ46_9ZZZZ
MSVLGQMIVHGTKPMPLCIFWLPPQLQDLIRLQLLLLPLPHPHPLPLLLPPLLPQDHLLLPHHQLVDHPPVDLIQALVLALVLALNPLLLAHHQALALALALLLALRQALDPLLVLPLVLLGLGAGVIVRKQLRGRL